MGALRSSVTHPGEIVQIRPPQPVRLLLQEPPRKSVCELVLFGMRGFGMKCDLIFFRGVNQWHPESVISAAAAISDIRNQ